MTTVTPVAQLVMGAPHPGQGRPLGSWPPMDAEELSADAETTERAAPIPSVVAVVVARGAAPHLEECLAGFRDMDYPDLTVLVVAETDEDLRLRVAAVMPSAFVRSVAIKGRAAGANEAIETVAGAPFLLFCHDDVVCEPTALRVLVEEAYRSNAAIVGPKVVDVARPEILREVGWSIDRFAVPHSDLERDELDQEQHDGVRDVFFVSDTCMLVRADLFTELGGFDPAADPGAAELDLCWRARLAGARVLIAPDARVGHYEDDPVGDRDRTLEQRHRVRALLVSTSTARLLWIAPVAFLMHLVEAIIFLARRRRDRAAILLGAWTWNLRHLGGLRIARRRAQAARTVPDREIYSLQFRGSARVTGFLSRSLHAEDRVRVISQRGRLAADSAATRFHSLRGLALLAVAGMAVIGARDLLMGRLAIVGQITSWPGVNELWRSFTSAWRFADLGSQAPAPPLFALVGAIRVVVLGAGGLGRGLLVVGAIPVAMIGAQRLGRRIAGSGWPGAMAAAVYGIVPLPRNAIEAGRIGPLMFYVAAPFVLLGVAQLSGWLPHRWPRRRIAVLAALGVAVAAAWWPLAIAFPFVVLVGAVIAAPWTGDTLAGIRLAVRAAAVTTGLGLLVLFPWPIAFLDGGDRTGALGIVFEPTGSFGDLLRFLTGSNGGSIGTWAFVAVGVVVAFVASGNRGVWTARLWGMALVSWCLAAFPMWVGTPSPAVDGVLVPAALAMAMLAGIGVAAFLGEIRRQGLGWPQVVSVLGAVGLVVATFAFVGDTVGGRWHQPTKDWNETLSWMSSQRDEGEFRVLWIGAPNVVPGDIHRSGRDGFALTNNGPGDLRDALPPPGGAGFEAAADAVARLRTRSTVRFGGLVGRMAVRYIAVPTRVDPGPAVGSVLDRTGSEAALAVALADQLDLREIDAAPGLRLFENAEWIPGQAVMPVKATVAGQRSKPVSGIGARSTPAGTVLWSQQFSGAWEAHGTRGDLRHARVEWANAFASPGGPVVVTFAHQWWRWPLVLIELAIVLVLARQALRRGRGARRRRRGQGESGVSESRSVVEHEVSS